MRPFILIGGILGVLFSSFASAQGTWFSHKEHLTRTEDCSSCHFPNPADVDFSRPTHAACKECHKELDFSAQKTSETVCQVCHGEVWSQIKSFPDRSRGIISLRPDGFSHKSHLDSEGEVARLTGRVTCNTCHPFDATGKAALPRHKECALCHGDANPSRPKDIPYLGVKATTKDCLGCHDDARKDRTVRPGPIGKWDGLNSYIGDLDFDHNRHQEHPGADSCGTCHADVAKSSNISQERRHLPTMQDCQECHGKSETVSPSYRIDNCIACHKTVQYGQRPAFPYHYGTGSHRDGATRERLYCAYCHDKNPEVFAPKPRYQDSCKSCHAAEGVEGTKEKLSPRFPLGKRTYKNGYQSYFATSADFKQGRAFDPATDAIDQTDVDLYQVISFDVRDFGAEGVGASFLGRVTLDPSFTPAFSQFENAFTLDQQPPADRGSVLSNGPIDRRRDGSFFVWRAFGELRDKALPGGLSALSVDLRAGRQTVFDAAVPVFLDGGYANLSYKKAFSVDVFGGKHVNFFVDDPVEAPLITGVGAKWTPSSFFQARFDLVSYLATITRGEVIARLTPYTWARLSTRFDAGVFSALDGGIDYYNPRSRTGLNFAYTLHQDAGVFDFDYTNITTQGGTLPLDGRQLTDYENLNIFTLPNYDRFEILLRQGISPKLGLSFLFAKRTLREDRAAIDALGAANFNDQQVLEELDAVLAAVALDNRLAYAMSYTEFGPGIDLSQVWIPGLKIGAHLTMRFLQPLEPIAIGEADAFFPDISGEGETSQLVFDLVASQKLWDGKLRLGAALEAQRFDYVGRFVELAGLNSLSASATALSQLTDKLSLRVLYAFTNDMVLFDERTTLLEVGSSDAPVIGDGDDGDEVNTHDVKFVQRLLLTLMLRF